jgi:predicted nucleotidyltransferase
MNIRWLLTDHPESVKFKEQKPITKPVVNSFDELPDGTQQMCKKIKTEINKIVDAKVFLFGSRINGRWDKESDYDIVILSLPTITQREQIKAIDFGVKVDRWFTRSFSSKMVEIV